MSCNRSVGNNTNDYKKTCHDSRRCNASGRGIFFFFVYIWGIKAASPLPQLTNCVAAATAGPIEKNHGGN